MIATLVTPNNSPEIINSIVLITNKSLKDKIFYILWIYRSMISIWAFMADTILSNSVLDDGSS